MQRADPRLDSNATYADRSIASARARRGVEPDIQKHRPLSVHKTGRASVASPNPLTAADRLTMSQIQRRTSTNMLKLAESLIGARMRDVGGDVAAETPGSLAHIRATAQERRNHELLRHIDALVANVSPAGYRFVPDHDDVWSFVVDKSAWALTALTCHIEVTQARYRRRGEVRTVRTGKCDDAVSSGSTRISPDAIPSELEWRRADAQLSEVGRKRAVSDLIVLLQGVDALLLFQAPADAEYFASVCNRPITTVELDRINAAFLRAYRWQCIVSGLLVPRFSSLLGELIGASEKARIGSEMAAVLLDVGYGASSPYGYVRVSAQGMDSSARAGRAPADRNHASRP